MITDLRVPNTVCPSFCFDFYDRAHFELKAGHDCLVGVAVNEAARRKTSSRPIKDWVAIIDAVIPKPIRNIDSVLLGLVLAVSVSYLPSDSRTAAGNQTSAAASKNQALGFWCVAPKRGAQFSDAISRRSVVSSLAYAQGLSAPPPG
jgi:hypothetical protein